jgi:hypothetical protein
MSNRLNGRRGFELYTRHFRKKRSKTFSSEDKAKAYAEKNGIKEYELENLKSPESQTKKIRIVHK